jgi:hypothetical protein
VRCFNRVTTLPCTLWMSQNRTRQDGPHNYSIIQACMHVSCMRYLSVGPV